MQRLPDLLWLWRHWLAHKRNPKLGKLSQAAFVFECCRLSGKQQHHRPMLRVQAWHAQLKPLDLKHLWQSRMDTPMIGSG